MVPAGARCGDSVVPIGLTKVVGLLRCQKFQVGWGRIINFDSAWNAPIGVKRASNIRVLSLRSELLRVREILRDRSAPNRSQKV